MFPLFGNAVLGFRGYCALFLGAEWVLLQHVLVWDSRVWQQTGRCYYSLILLFIMTSVCVCLFTLSWSLDLGFSVWQFEAMQGHDGLLASGLRGSLREWWSLKLDASRYITFAPDTDPSRGSDGCGVSPAPTARGFNRLRGESQGFKIFIIRIIPKTISYICLAVFQPFSHNNPPATTFCPITFTPHLQFTSVNSCFLNITSTTTVSLTLSH